MNLISIKKNQNHENKQDEDTFKTFQVPIGNAKVVNHLSFKKTPQFSDFVKKR